MSGRPREELNIPLDPKTEAVNPKLPTPMVLGLRVPDTTNIVSVHPFFL